MGHEIHRRRNPLQHGDLVGKAHARLSRPPPPAARPQGAPACVPWPTRCAGGAALHPSELVFAGYGVEAPEFNWDDFKDVDVKGKTIIVLVNDPAVPDAADPTRLEPKVFGGNAMTYSGQIGRAND